MKIAVIDEGVMSAFKDEVNIREDLMVNNEYSVVNRPDDVDIITDHGYNVCKIINMHAPEAEIISIRIFNTSEMKTNIENLMAAFNYCLEKRISIIHLSGGTTNLFDDYLLRDVIKKIINNNQIIVAAHSNNKGLSFPALYPGVFSARADELYSSYHSIEDKWGYSFLMPSKHEININKKFDYITQIANSYAAPALTAKIYNIIDTNNDNNIGRVLGNLGINNNVFLCELPCFLDNVTIVNLDNKVIIEEVLPFEVRNIYDDIKYDVDSKDYIFIPHNNKEVNIEKFKEFFNILPANTDRIRIFYLGIINNDIEAIISCYSFEFWVLPENEIYPINVSNFDLSDCGIIYFQGNKDAVYYIMARLRDILLEDGFNCLAISDCLEATLYGIYFFEDLSNSRRREQLEYVLEPDVELIFAENEIYRRVENSILIEVGKEWDRIRLLISGENTKEGMDIFGKEDFQELYRRITDI